MVFEKLQADHVLLLKLAEDLARLTSRNEQPPRLELFRVRTDLATVLIRHLKEEDWVVYPAILRNNAHPGREAVRALQAQTGNLAQTFSDYMKLWTSFAIEQDWPNYCKETLALMRALKRRVIREDNSLYASGTSDAALPLMSSPGLE